MRAFVVCLLLLVSAGSAFRPASTGHAELTRDALKGLTKYVNGVGRRFFPETIARIARANERVDGLSTGLLHPENHFDSELLQASSQRLVGLRSQIIQSLTAIPSRGPEAQALLGQALHTLQDFYSSTNWVNGNSATLSSLGTGTVADPGSGQTCGADNSTLTTQTLTSGYFNVFGTNQGAGSSDPALFNGQAAVSACTVPQGKCLHGWDIPSGGSPPVSCNGISKDVPTSQLFPKAYNLAFEATLDFVDSILEDSSIKTNDQAVKALMRPSSQLGLVIDLSGGMEPLLSQLSSQLGDLLTFANSNLEFASFLLKTFTSSQSDPVTVTSNSTAFAEAIQALTETSADCTSLDGSVLQDVIRHAEPGASMVLFTTTALTDAADAESVIASAVAKSVSFTVFHYQFCNQDPGFLPLLARSSGGELFSIYSPSLPAAFVPLVKPALFPDRQTLFSAQDILFPTDPVRVFKVRVDGSVRFLTFRLSTLEDSAALELFGPDPSSGLPTPLNDTVSGVQFFSFTNAQFFLIPSPAPGVYTFTATLPGGIPSSFSVQVKGRATAKLNRFEFIRSSFFAGQLSTEALVGAPLSGSPATARAVLDYRTELPIAVRVAFVTPGGQVLSSFALARAEAADTAAQFASSGLMTFSTDQTAAASSSSAAYDATLAARTASFVGTVTVPSRPFRALVTGVWPDDNTPYAAFQRLSPQIFRPQSASLSLATLASSVPAGALTRLLVNLTNSRSVPETFEVHVESANPLIVASLSLPSTAAAGTSADTRLVVPAQATRSLVLEVFVPSSAAPSGAYGISTRLLVSAASADRDAATSLVVDLPVSRPFPAQSGHTCDFTSSAIVPFSQCPCAPGWTGTNCATPACPNDCSGHGQCTFDLSATPKAVCVCDALHFGSDCGRELFVAIDWAAGTSSLPFCGQAAYAVNSSAADYAAFYGLSLPTATFQFIVDGGEALSTFQDPNFLGAKTLRLPDSTSPASYRLEIVIVFPNATINSTTALLPMSRDLPPIGLTYSFTNLATCRGGYNITWNTSDPISLCLSQPSDNFCRFPLCTSCKPYGQLVDMPDSALFSGTFKLIAYRLCDDSKLYSSATFTVTTFSPSATFAYPAGGESIERCSEFVPAYTPDPSIPSRSSARANIGTITNGVTFTNLAILSGTSTTPFVVPATAPLSSSYVVSYSYGGCAAFRSNSSYFSVVDVATPVQFTALPAEIANGQNLTGCTRYLLAWTGKSGTYTVSLRLPSGVNISIATNIRGNSANVSIPSGYSGAGYSFRVSPSNTGCAALSPLVALSPPFNISSGASIGTIAVDPTVKACQPFQVIFNFVGCINPSPPFVTLALYQGSTRLASLMSTVLSTSLAPVNYVRITPTWANPVYNSPVYSLRLSIYNNLTNVYAATPAPFALAPADPELVSFPSPSVLAPLLRCRANAQIPLTINTCGTSALLSLVLPSGATTQQLVSLPSPFTAAGPVRVTANLQINARGPLSITALTNPPIALASPVLSYWNFTGTGDPAYNNSVQIVFPRSFPTSSPSCLAPSVPFRILGTPQTTYVYTLYRTAPSELAVDSQAATTISSGLASFNFRPPGDPGTYKISIAPAAGFNGCGLPTDVYNTTITVGGAGPGAAIRFVSSSSSTVSLCDSISVEFVSEVVIASSRSLLYTADGTLVAVLEETVTGVSSDGLRVAVQWRAVPGQVQAGASYKVRLASKCNAQVFADSPAFTVLPDSAPVIALTSPNAFTSFLNSSMTAIIWNVRQQQFCAAGSFAVRVYRNGAVFAELPSASSGVQFQPSLPGTYQVEVVGSFGVSSLSATANLSSFSAPFSVAAQVPLPPTISSVSVLSTVAKASVVPVSFATAGDAIDTIRIDAFKVASTVGNVTTPIDPPEYDATLATFAPQGPYQLTVDWPTINSAYTYILRLTATTDPSATADSQPFTVTGANPPPPPPDSGSGSNAVAIGVGVGVGVGVVALLVVGYFVYKQRAKAAGQTSIAGSSSHETDMNSVSLQQVPASTSAERNV